MSELIIAIYRLMYFFLGKLKLYSHNFCIIHSSSLSLEARWALSFSHLLASLPASLKFFLIGSLKNFS